MQVIDLSHEIRPGMPVYPGTEPPKFEYGTTIARDGFVEKKITMFSHTGTHIDAPGHILEKGATLDSFEAGHFIGPAILIPASVNGETIGRAILEPYEERIRRARFVILKTGWSSRWGTESYFSKYPVLEHDAAEWLAKFDLAAVGIDAISIDPADSLYLPNHRIFMKRNICILENLTALEAVLADKFTLSCLPLKIQDADGSPIRAIAIMP